VGFGSLGIPRGVEQLFQHVRSSGRLKARMVARKRRKGKSQGRRFYLNSSRFPCHSLLPFSPVYDYASGCKEYCRGENPGGWCKPAGEHRYPSHLLGFGKGSPVVVEGVGVSTRYDEFMVGVGAGKVADNRHLSLHRDGFGVGCS